MDKYLFPFEKLGVWHLAINLAEYVLNLLEKFNQNKHIRLISQMEAAATSPAQNTCPVKQLEIMFYFTYVLQSTVDKNFYAGFTSNLKLRFEQHQRGFVKATKNRKPFELIYYEACLDKNDAIKREKYFKSYHGKLFLRKRLKSYLTG